MCSSRRSFWREEEAQEPRKDPIWEAFDRERHAEPVQPIADADRERSERDAERDRERVPAGIGN